MNKSTHFYLRFRMALIMTGLYVSLVGYAIADDAGVEPDGELASCDGIVTFPDPNLEAVVREHIDLETGNITNRDVETLTELFGEGRGIADLTNIHCLVNLEVADLIDNRISNGSPLSHLTKLQDLILDANEISDLTFLENLLVINYLQLEDNHITDIGPLVANSGLGEGDAVFIRGNPIDCNSPQVLADIQALKDRGAEVEDDCTGESSYEDGDIDKETSVDIGSSSDADADGDVDRSSDMHGDGESTRASDDSADGGGCQMVRERTSKHKSLVSIFVYLLVG